MASNDKLWFQLGVRDDISKVLNSLIGKAEDLRRAMVLSDKDLGFGNAQKNALDLEKAIVDVSTTLNKLRAQKGNLVDPEDINTADKMERKFKQMLTSLNKLKREIKNKLKTEGLNAIEDLDINGLVQNILNEKGFSLAQSQTNTFLSENAKKMNDASQAAIGLANAYDKVVASGKRTNSILNQISMQVASALSVYAIEGLVKNIITIGGEFEIQHKALQNILGDVQQANTLFAQLKSLAVESPFSFKQEVTYSKQLAAFNIPYKEIFDTTKRLGDLSAGLGVDMNRLILAYGQVRSAAVLRGQELRQFTEAGIPMVQALADEFTKLNGKVVTTGEVFSLISKRAVPFEMVKKVLWDMTNEGGRFYNMQFELADTLAGKWSNLRDAWEIMLSDFAKGTSTGGQALKSLVSLTTSLIKSINALSPLMWGVMGGIGSAKGLKLLENLFTAGLSTMKMNVIEAQRLNAVEIQRRFILGEISAERRKELLQQNQSMQHSMEQLAISGRMSSLQMLRAYKEGLISKEYLVQAREMSIINAQEYQAIVTGNQRLLLQQRISKAMNIGWTGWAGVAIMAGVSVYQAYSQWADNIKQQTESAVEGAKNKSKELGKIVEQNEKSGIPEEREDLRSRIKQMQEVLENSDAYTVSIEAQINRAKDLREQYEILLKAIKEAKEQSDFTVQHGADIEGMIKASSSKFSGGWDWAKLATFGLWDVATGEDTWGNFFDLLFNNDISKNFKEFDEALNNLNNQKTILSSYKDEYVRVIDTMREHYSKFAEETKNMSPEKAFEYLSKSDVWLNVFEKQLGQGEAKLSSLVERLGEHSKSVSEQRNKILEDDANRMFGWYAEKLGMSLEKYKDYCKNHESYTKQMITSIVASLSEGSAAAKNELAKVLLKFFGLASEESDKIVEDSRRKQYRDQTTQGRHVLKTLINGAKEKGWGDKNGNGVWDVKWVNKYFGDGVGYLTGIEAMRNKWLELTEEREAARRSGAKLSEQEEKEWERLNKAAEVYDFKKKKSKQFGNKETGKDTELEAAKTQLEEVKKFYSEYKKYREIYGAKKAQSIVEEIFGMKPGEGNEIINDYKGTISKIINIADTTEPRKKFIIGGKQLLGEIKLDDNKQKIDYALSELQEYIQKQTAGWNLYKQILDKTGDRNFAAAAFRDVRIWDDISKKFADKLNTRMEEEGLKGLSEQDWYMTDAAAKEHFKTVNGGYELWKKIVEHTSRNYTDALSKGADAMEKQLSIAEKIKNEEQQIADLMTKMKNAPDEATRRSYQAQIAVRQKNVSNLSYEAFQQSEDYLRFFGAVLTMANEEIEATAQTIKNRLIVELSRGNFTAHQYIKSLKDVNNQLTKGRTALSGDFMTFLSGGQQGLIELRQEEAANAAIRLEVAKREVEEIKKRQEKGEEVSIEEMMAADAEYAMAQEQLKNAAKALGITVKQYQTLSKMSSVLQVVTGVLDGLQGAASGLSEMFEALGNDSAANTFSDIADAIGGIGSVFKPVNNIVSNAMSGNVGGIVSSAISAPVDLFTGPITAFAKLHDKRLQREIEASQQRQREMENLTKNIESILNRVLGGVYTFASSQETESVRREFNEQVIRRAVFNELYEQWGGDNSRNPLTSIYGKMRGNKDTYEAFIKAGQTQEYYDMQRALLLAQQEELRKQLAAEEDKKNSDDGAIESYRQQIKELDDQIKNFALDMAKSLYDIDIHSWATELTDAIVSAWENGEDAAEAYSNKVKDLMKNLTKNILAQKVLEAEFKRINLDGLISDLMDESSGKLNYDAIGRLSEKLGEAIPNSVDIISAVLDKMEADGYIDKGNGNGSGSASSGIKSITENTADLLASYINAIRADVSVNRQTLYQIMVAVQGQSEMPVIAQAQLNELRSISANTMRNANAADNIYRILSLVVNGGEAIKVK